MATTTMASGSAAYGQHAQHAAQRNTNTKKALESYQRMFSILLKEAPEKKAGAQQLYVQLQQALRSGVRCVHTPQACCLACWRGKLRVPAPLRCACGWLRRLALGRIVPLSQA